MGDKSTNYGRNRQNNRRQKEVQKIPKKLKNFVKLRTVKKYVKANKDADFLSKKDAKRMFRGWRVEVMPSVIEFLYRFGGQQDCREFREDLYEVIMEDDMIELMKKSLTNEEYFIENIELFPVIAYDLIRTAEMWEQENKDDPKFKGYNLDNLVDLVKAINKKKIKKLVKKGIPEDLAFDLMCVYPVNGLIRPKTVKTLTRVRQIFQIVYAHSKETKVDVEKLFNLLFKREQYQSVITFAMLERKEKYVNFTDTQKESFNAISVWVFKKLESMDKEDIGLILREYFNARKRDKAKNQDSARRFFIGSLPEDEYPRITSVVNRMKTSDSSIEEFL